MQLPQQDRALGSAQHDRQVRRASRTHDVIHPREFAPEHPAKEEQQCAQRLVGVEAAVILRVGGSQGDDDVCVDYQPMDLLIPLPEAGVVRRSTTIPTPYPHQDPALRPSA